MREELLDDSVPIVEEDYIYLQELQQYPPVLQKLALVIGGYILVDIIFILKLVFFVDYFSMVSVFFNVLVDGGLIFLVKALWEQMNVQGEAHKRDFENNEALFLQHNYKTWYLLGFVLLVLISRTLFFIFNGSSTNPVKKIT